MGDGRTWRFECSQFKRTPQYSLNEFVIRKLHSLVVAATSIKFKSAFLHA